MLESDCAIGKEDLENTGKQAGIQVQPGDVALVRTGWSRLWDGQDRRYISKNRV